LPEVVCDTSPIQYLHQLGLLHILPALARSVTVPPGVLEEINVGRKLGLNLPDLAAVDWITTRRPVSFAALPLATDLGPGEAEVLALALEAKDAIVVLDDALARHVAESLERSARLRSSISKIGDSYPNAAHDPRKRPEGNSLYTLTTDARHSQARART
jgi:predicted nucleic acid-binding protein